MMVHFVVSFIFIVLHLDIISTQSSRSAPSVTDATCKDTIWYCKNYIPYCLTHKDRLKGRCDRTCRYCGPKICDDRRTDCKHVLQYCSSLKGVCDKSCGHCGDKNAAAAIRSRLICRDTRPDCQLYKNFCDSHASSMKNVCTKTCNFCDNSAQERKRRKLTTSQAKGKKSVIATAAKTETEECRDRGKFCKHVQKYCHTQAPMKRACAKTCGFCGGVVKAAIAVKALHEDVCRDERSDCKYLANYCNTYTSMRNSCRKTCGHCGSKKAASVKKLKPSVCRDVRNDCKSLKKYCGRYKKSMSRSCKLTCGYCGKRDTKRPINNKKPQMIGNRSTNQITPITKRPQVSSSTRKAATATKRQPEQQKCVDKISKKNCYLLKKYGKCNGELKTHCLRTCGACKEKPKSCADSLYGCCWNKKTMKKDPDGSNCQPCKDKYKSLCDALKKSCNTISYARRVCVKSCGTCN